MKSTKREGALSPKKRVLSWRDSPRDNSDTSSADEEEEDAAIDDGRPTDSGFFLCKNCAGSADRQPSRESPLKEVLSNEAKTATHEEEQASTSKSRILSASEKHWVSSQLSERTTHIGSNSHYLPFPLLHSSILMMLLLANYNLNVSFCHGLLGWCNSRINKVNDNETGSVRLKCGFFLQISLLLNLCVTSDHGYHFFLMNVSRHVIVLYFAADWHNSCCVVNHENSCDFLPSCFTSKFMISVVYRVACISIELAWFSLPLHLYCVSNFLFDS